MSNSAPFRIDPVALRADFNTLCNFGGRFAGTPGELAARTFVTERLAETGATNGTRTYSYEGWQRISSSLAIAGRPNDVLDSTSLVLSHATPPAGVELELVDLGRGTPDDFAANRDRIAGRAVLVRHEFPFTVRHVHRRRKYGWAKAAGARAFLIANYLPGAGVVSGSSGRGDPDDIVSLGISHDGGVALAQTEMPAIRLRVDSERVPMQGAHVLFEMPGQTDEWVVLCAHLDGHDLAESALDNATGVTAVLAIARALAPQSAANRRGLRVMLFTFEEWGLYGSSLYVNGLAPEERARIAFVVNLDTIVGSPRLSALISEMDDVGDFVARTTAGAALPVDLVRPVLGNSDHYNFFLGGIPSFRLIAGYEDEHAATRFLLTPADKRALVDLDQLLASATIAGTLALAACAHDGPVARHRTNAEVAALLDPTDPWVSDRVSTK